MSCPWFGHDRGQGARHGDTHPGGTGVDPTLNGGELAVEVSHSRVHAGTVGDLLERWYADASPAWAPTTAAHTRSILDRHLIPRLGQVAVGS